MNSWWKFVPESLKRKAVHTRYMKERKNLNRINLGGLVKMNKALNFVRYFGDIALFLVLCFYTALFCLIFHLGWAVDVITVDTPQEAHSAIPFQDYIMYFLLGSPVLIIYIYYLFGHQTYKKIKIFILTFIFGLSVVLSAIELIAMVILIRTMPVEFYISQLTVLIFPLLLILVITKKHRGFFKMKNIGYLKQARL